MLRPSLWTPCKVWETSPSREPAPQATASAGPTVLLDTKPALRPLELSTDRRRLEKWRDSGFFRPTKCKASSWRWGTEVVSRMEPELASSPSLRASLTIVGGQAGQAGHNIVVQGQVLGSKWVFAPSIKCRISFLLEATRGPPLMGI